jgi:CRISPR-associated protein Csd2
MMFDHDRSASRGTMAPQKLIVFKHASALGNAPAHKLFERVTVALKDKNKPARDIADYAITINRDALPAGVEILDKL